MKCPVCRKDISIKRIGYFGVSRGNINYRERKRLEGEQERRVLINCSEVYAIYDDVLGVKPNPYAPTLMHKKCANAYNATVRVLIATGVIKELDRFTPVSSKIIANSVYGKFGVTNYQIIMDDPVTEISTTQAIAKRITYHFDNWINEYLKKSKGDLIWQGPQEK